MRFESRSAKNYNGEVPRQRDARLWWKCIGGVFIGLMLVGSIAVSAKQRHEAHECSQQNVELQRERERLITEKKRLEVERENALKLDELKKRAKKIGMRELTAEHINSFNPPATETSKKSAAKLPKKKAK